MRPGAARPGGHEANPPGHAVGASVRPALEMQLRVAGAPSAIDSRLEPAPIPANRVTAAVFTIPSQPASSAEAPASICLTGAAGVNWGGTPLPAPPSASPATVGGAPIAGRIAVWYLPAAGAQRSYLARAGEILRRAALFRPGFVGPALYVVILLLALPALAIASVRCLAVASANGAATGGTRAMAVSLFVIAALNFACWALITPPFQAPDEVDHFAYTQSLVERGEAPARSASSPLPRWSSSESLALEDMSFFTDHQVGDTRMPWTAGQQALYRSQASTLRPSAADGGGDETAATHGALYYATLAPAYILASGSPLDQLTLMRLTSALIGALTVVFAYLLARELAPGRQWLAVLAALLVAFQPMYGFISGSVNNDVGLNAGAAALELLLIVLMRRGVRLSLGLAVGALLVALPIVKGTAFSLYPVAGVALLVTAWRHHRRADAAGWAGIAAGAAAAYGLSALLSGVFRSSTQGAVGSAGPGAATSAVGEALAHPLGYLAYVWEVFLPRLSFMAPHFEGGTLPGFVIFVERGWGAFGWYDVFFQIGSTPSSACHARRRAARCAGGPAGMGLRPPQRRGGGDPSADADRRRGGLRGGLLYDRGEGRDRGIRSLRVPSDRAPGGSGRRLPARVPSPLGAPAGAALLVGMLALSYSAQLVTLTGFYA